MKTADLLVSPEEIVKLQGLRDIQDIYTANAIIEIYKTLKPPIPDRCDPNLTFYHDCLLAAIYNAGRISGIREERAKRKRIKPAIYRVGFNF